jgi:2-dehydro-3-deoxyphosphogluconate aldolase / (4S)-4-hydroxy-2-oxoglutarate aldolase
MTVHVAPGPALVASRIVAIVRGTEARHTAAVLDTLVEAGIRCLEVTMNTPGALGELRAARDRLPGDIELGGGTVVTGEQVDAVADMGGSFVVAPDARPAVADRALARGLGYYPGALTPTEVGAAWERGASAVKLFPASLGGPGYLRELRGPFRDVPLLPTGGVGIDDAGSYLRAGGLAVGVGGALLGDALDGGDLAALRERALRLLASVAEASRR